MAHLCRRAGGPLWCLPLEFWGSILPTKGWCICILCVLVSQACPPLYNPADCSPPGSSVHGILQARRLEWVAIPFSRGSSPPRGRTQVSCIAGRFFTVWAPREAPICTQDGQYLGNNLKQSWACQVDGHFPGRRAIFYHSYVNFDFSFTLYMIKQALREHSFDSLPFSLRNSAYWRHSVTHCQAVCFHLGALFLKHKITVFFFTAFLHTQSFSIVHFWQVSG